MFISLNLFVCICPPLLRDIKIFILVRCVKCCRLESCMSPQLSSLYIISISTHLSAAAACQGGWANVAVILILFTPFGRLMKDKPSGGDIKAAQKIAEQRHVSQSFRAADSRPNNQDSCLTGPSTCERPIKIAASMACSPPPFDYRVGHTIRDGKFTCAQTLTGGSALSRAAHGIKTEQELIRRWDSERTC